MGVFDLLTLLVAGAGYALGRSRGFAWQVSGLLTLVGGGICATVLSRPVGPVFGEGILGAFAAWVVIYAVIAICLYVLTLRFKTKLEEMEFDELDRRFGGLLGGFKSLAVFGLVTLVAVPLSAGVEGAVKGSLSGRALKNVVHELSPLVPERVHDAFGPYLEGGEAEPASDPAPGSSPQPSQPETPSSPVSATPNATPASTSPATPPVPWVSHSTGPGPRPSTTTPEEVLDPFDTSQDPRDPLAPR